MPNKKPNIYSKYSYFSLNTLFLWGVFIRLCCRAYKFVFDINEAMRKYYKNKDEHYSEQKYRRSDDSFYNKDASKYDYIKSRISSGYVKDFKPAKNINGEYYTIDGRAKQIQYQGSAEQRRDLEMIDEYAIKHPGF